MWLCNNKRTTSILLLLNFAFILTLLIMLTLLLTPSASGYEISIYNSYPIAIWVFIIFTLLISYLGFSNCAQYKGGKICLAFILNIILINSILLYMPLIRGYAIYGREDVLSHVGMIKDILINYHVGINNIYPFDHLMAILMYYQTNINITNIINIIPPIFSFLYLLWALLLIKQISQSYLSAIFLFSLNFILIFGNEQLMFAPNVQSFFLFPLLLFLCFKTISLFSLRYFSLMSIMMAAAIFFHPETVIFFIATTIIIIIYMLLGGKIPYKLSITLSLFLAILFLAFAKWASSFPAFVYLIQVVMNNVKYGSGRTEFAVYQELILRTQPAISDLISAAMALHGQKIILGIASLVIIIYSFYLFLLKRKRLNNLITLSIFSTCFIFFSILTMMAFLFDLVLGFERVAKYTLFFSIFVVGFGSQEILDFKFINKNSSYLIKHVLTVVLVIIIVISLFNLFWSPIIKRENQQVTYSEIAGMEKFFAKRNNETLIQEIGISQSRFHDFIYGRNIYRMNIRYYDPNVLMINHFNYQNETHSGPSNYYQDDRYVLISTLGRVTYPSLYPNYQSKWRFNQNDFTLFEEDNKVIKIYTNSGLDTYLMFN